MSLAGSITEADQTDYLHISSERYLDKQEETRRILKILCGASSILQNAPVKHIENHEWFFIQ